MASPILPNDLDRAIQAMIRSNSAAPQLFRALVEGELALLVPYHPEIEGGVMELKNGQAFPFVQAQRDGKEAVLVYSSEQRADESIKKLKWPPKAYSVAFMPAKQVLEILGAMEMQAVLNPACSTGEMILPPNLMRDLASGEALQPRPSMGRQRARFVAIDPANYPTNLTQALFEFMKQHRNIMAAWIFTAPRDEPDLPPGTLYRFAVAMNPPDPTLLDDATTVSSMCQRDGEAVEFGSVGTDPATLRKLVKLAQPFFVNPELWPAALGEH